MKNSRVEVLKKMRCGLDYYMKLARTWVNDPVEPEDGKDADRLNEIADHISDAMFTIDKLVKEALK